MAREKEDERKGNPMIPDEAVEAAARVMFAQRSGSDSWRDVPEAHHWFRKYARAALEAAAPHLMAAEVSAATFTRMVDEVLEHKGTPRRRLFEYPYRDDDSRDAIKSAETLVRDILRWAKEAPDA